MLFQVRVEGFDYVGVGNSTNKKDAQANCATLFEIRNPVLIDKIGET
jgi:hypothetical protein